VGVVAAYRMVRKVAPIQLVLAGGGATDDPGGGKAVLEEVMEAAGADPDIHVLLLPSDSRKTVNALQRREFVRENILLTRHLLEYLTLMLVTLRHTQGNVIEV